MVSWLPQIQNLVTSLHHLCRSLYLRTSCSFTDSWQPTAGPTGTAEWRPLANALENYR